MTSLVDLNGEVLTNGDVLLVEGRTPYAVQDRLNAVAVFALARDGSGGQLVIKITDIRFDVPTTVVSLATPPTPTTTYDAVSVPKPGK
ncbi:hypothetical protein AB0G02_16200 [Actinosynnema sp. NPDC023658]|uniref:hypothetical protein n=1 Tax=Actinosynnema sp. NPDC023658 TaxID=3155465 RepID=UPI0033DF3479